MERLKLRQPDRRQVTFRAVEIEQLVGADHPVRAIWELSGRLDLSGFAGALRTQRDQGGRVAWDPRLLVAVWIWAYAEGIRSAREMERQMEYRPELEWLCGMAVINHHTLSDFRVGHAEALEQLRQVEAGKRGEERAAAARVSENEPVTRGNSSRRWRTWSGGWGKSRGKCWRTQATTAAPILRR